MILPLALVFNCWLLLLPIAPKFAVPSGEGPLFRLLRYEKRVRSLKIVYDVYHLNPKGWKLCVNIKNTSSRVEDAIMHNFFLEHTGELHIFILSRV
jgi:hypothetical protein